MAPTRVGMSSVARAVSSASSLTSPATTAKPLPASPARAASMVAFRASRLVWAAMFVMILMTGTISADESPSFCRIRPASPEIRTACPATSAALDVLRAISPIELPISSAPDDTVAMFWLISSEAAATAFARPAERDADEFI